MDRYILTQPPPIMGKSPKIFKVFREIKRIALKDLPVLISGETGTYKELVARAIHHNSPRTAGPFITISMTPAQGVPAEPGLFGFTGSAVKRTCKIDEAHGGTVYVDEISEIDIKQQEKLLCFLKKESGLAGNSDFHKPDVRLIGATSRNLKEAVADGRFRQDLYDIFSSVHIKIPPLRERKDDIIFLAKYLLEKTVEKFETGPKEFSREARDFLPQYHWPFNMREIENTIKRAAILSPGPVIQKKDLIGEDIGSCSIKEFLEEKLNRYLKEMTKLENCNLYDTVLSEVESSLISIVLKETEGNQLRAAKTLGINRNTLRAKIKEYKIRL
jgi:two-component system, NtrC family, nitrogen regulation response regulator GlnG